jgi:hypothetical protein
MTILIAAFTLDTGKTQARLSATLHKFAQGEFHTNKKAGSLLIRPFCLT